VTAHWAADFRNALLSLGQEEVAVQRIIDEALGHATEAGRDPWALFGPAHAYARHVVDQLHYSPAGTAVAPMVGPPVLALRGVSKQYRRRTILPRTDLAVHAGQVAAVVGANGSGKSTLLKICAGLVRPDTGHVYRTGRIGYVPQDGGTGELLTADEHFVLFGSAAGMPRRMARSTGRHVAKRLSWRPDSDVPAGRLSGGTRQKLNLALGSLHSPDLLLLDEPYQGFDRDSYLDFWDDVWMWRDEGRGVVVVTHRVEQLDRVDGVVDLGHPGWSRAGAGVPA
jgi:ABC-2 type transport system ATP-binding protein